MIISSLLLAAVLATATPWVVGRVAPEARRSWWWIAVPTAAALGGFLAWAGARERGESWAMVIAFAFVAAVLAIQVVIDLAVHRLPRVLSHCALVVLLVASAIHPSGTTSGLWGAIAGAVLMTVITAVFMGVSRGSLGMGDLQFSPLLGALVGWFDPVAVFILWFVTAIVGGAIALVVMAMRRFDRRSHIPYGPPMVVGAIAGVLYAVVA